MKRLVISLLFLSAIALLIMHLSNDLSYIPQFTEEEMQQICIEEGIE